MSNTYRKDRNGKEYKESLKKREARYRCRCERCVGKKDMADKIAEKEFKTEIEEIIEEGVDCDNPIQEEIINRYNTQWTEQI